MTFQYTREGYTPSRGGVGLGEQQKGFAQLRRASAMGQRIAVYGVIQNGDAKLEAF